MDCSHVYKIYDNYILIVVSSIGVILNSFCVIAFFGSPQLNNTKTNMFKYLKVKSICDTIAMIRNLTRNLFFLDFNFDAGYHPNLHLCRLYVFSYYYLGGVVLLLSILCEVAANFNRYRTMTNRFRFFDKISFNIKIFVMISYCSFFYIHRFVYFQCIEEFSIESDTSFSSNHSNQHLNHSYFSNNSNSSHPLHDSYHVFYINNFPGPYSYVFLKLHTFVRDCVTMFLILIFSIATMIFTKSSFKKTRVTNTHVKESQAKKMQNQRAKRAQSNMTNMVLVSNLILFFGHFFSFVKFTIGTISINNDCYESFELTLFFLAYSLNFFVYFIFNKHFRNFFFKPMSKSNDETTQFTNTPINK
jgi:hypothetical protein